MQRTTNKGWWLAVSAAFAVAACGEDTPMPEPMGPTEIAAPTSVMADPVGVRQIDVSWAAVTNAASYIVQRQLVGGTFQDIATGVAAISHSDESGIAPATVYNYRVIAVAADGSTSAPSDPVSVQSGGTEVTGNINTATTWTADQTYVLKGFVTVQAGAVLTIEAGTTILGDKASQGALLVIRGGQIVAEGTETNPIIFTSASAPGNRSKGDWGGVIINGNSNCNFPAGQCLGEGNTGAYGGDNAADNSGTLRYVRIEFAGLEVSPDNELNGLTLNGVGSGTTLEYIQSHGGEDDGIEFFGGTVDLKYAIVTQASDDSFDWSTGWQGRGQFWIVQADPEDGDNGWEVDNNEQDFDSDDCSTQAAGGCRTFGQIYNFTLVGRPDGMGSRTDHGILFRRGVAGMHSCGIVLGFGEAGLNIDDLSTSRLAGNDSLNVTETIFFDNGRDEDGFASPGVNFDPDTEVFSGGASEDQATGVTADFEAAWADVAGGSRSITEEDPMLADPYNLASPDFSPTAGSPALAACSGAPDDGWFTVANYIGAVADASDTWYQGWIETASN